MASLINIVAAVSVSLVIYTLFNYATLPALFQNFLDWGQREIQIGTLKYQIAPIKFVVVTLLLIMITENLWLALAISLFIYLNLATIQAYLNPKLTSLIKLTPAPEATTNATPNTTPVLTDSIEQPNSIATQTLESDLNKDPAPSIIMTPPGGHQGLSPEAGALQTLGQGDPSIGHWNPYINR